MREPRRLGDPSADAEGERSRGNPVIKPEAKPEGEAQGETQELHREAQPGGAEFEGNRELKHRKHRRTRDSG